MKPATLPALALALVAATAAQAEESCNQPVGNWKSREAVHAMASERGWTLKRIKIDDGCYEIYGTDQEGRRFEAKIDPVTLDVIEVENHHHHK
ncbi:MAG: PepSY domain-containing protein [Proteobacteria bacterium]|nr:PepSY domain-containing protein [Pseudomonadota bacterium]